MKFVFIPVFLGLLLTACENDTSVTATTRNLPTYFRMTGHGDGQDSEGRTAECSANTPMPRKDSGIKMQKQKAVKLPSY